MKFVLIAILINATSGDPIAVHIDGKAFDTPKACGEAAQNKGIVKASGNVATEYVCRQTDDNGVPVPEAKVGPNDTPWNDWLNKHLTGKGENNS